MKEILTQQPSAITAGCALVLELPPIATAPAAHARVGYGAVATQAAPGAALTRSQWLRQQETVQVPVKGTNGFAVKQSATGMDPVGGVRGIPPRGWPV